MNHPDMSYLDQYRDQSDYEETTVAGYRLAVLQSQGYWVAIALDGTGVIAQDELREAAVERAVTYLRSSTAAS